MSANLSRLWTPQLLSERTGLPLRTIVHWGASAVLRPTRQTSGKGQGKHRQYAEREAEICAMLAPLVRFGLLVGLLRAISAHIRSLYPPARHPPDSISAIQYSKIVRARAGNIVWLWIDKYSELSSFAFTEQKRGPNSLGLPETDDWLSVEHDEPEPMDEMQLGDGEQWAEIPPELWVETPVAETIDSSPAFLLTSVTAALWRLRHSTPALPRRGRGSRSRR
jgi:hypothetical protein